MDFNSCFNSFIQTGELICPHEIQRFSWTFQMSMIDKNPKTSDDFRCFCSIHPSLYGRQLKQQQTAERCLWCLSQHFFSILEVDLEDSEISFGEIPMTRLNSDIVWFALSSTDGLWQAKGGFSCDLKIGGSREDRFYVDWPLDRWY